MTDQAPPPGWNAGTPKKSNFNLGAALLIGSILVVAYVFAQNRPGTPPTAAGNGGVVPQSTALVVYGLTGTASHADLTYTDASGNIQQQSGVSIPLNNTSGTRGIRFTVERGAFVQFSAQNAGESGELTCTISVNGTVINTGHSSGGFTIVSCSATVP